MATRTSKITVTDVGGGARTLAPKKIAPAAREVPPPLPEIPEFTDEELRRYQAWCEDKAVRSAREHGYCDRVTTVLNDVFGTPLDGKKYRDSDGMDCWKDTWRDKAGYDRNGFDVNGLDREKYSREGFNLDGYNREGFDLAGVHKTDPRRYRFSRHGYDAAGFNFHGQDRNGIRVSSALDRAFAFVYDQAGYNPDGYDTGGYKRTGNYSPTNDVSLWTDDQKKAKLIKWGLWSDPEPDAPAAE